MLILTHTLNLTSFIIYSFSLTLTLTLNLTHSTPFTALTLFRQDFPGQRIGPEPTTDRFTAIMHSTEGNEGGRQVGSDAVVNLTFYLPCKFNSSLDFLHF